MTNKKQKSTNKTLDEFATELKEFFQILKDKDKDFSLEKYLEIIKQIDKIKDEYTL